MILDHFRQDGEGQVAQDMNALVEACTSLLINAAMNDHDGKLLYLKALHRIAPPAVDIAPVPGPINAQLHALVAEFKESDDVYEATLGLILHRQTNKLDGEAFIAKLREIITGLERVTDSFSKEWQIIVGE